MRRSFWLNDKNNSRVNLKYLSCVLIKGLGLLQLHQSSDEQIGNDNETKYCDYEEDVLDYVFWHGKRRIFLVRYFSRWKLSVDILESGESILVNITKLVCYLYLSKYRKYYNPNTTLFKKGWYLNAYYDESCIQYK